VVASGYAGDGLSAYFNRGTLMSQVVSRLVGGDVTVKSLKQLKVNLANPGFPGRRYLSGDARHAMLGFLADADKRGSQIYAALYEVNDAELIAGLQSFGSRAHVLIGNGSSTGADTANELVAASVDVHHRDLSHSGKSSPSVHNKFVVEVEPGAPTASRVLTGSTNWTVTGLCTQLNNVLIMERPATAERFRNQWTTLVDAGDDMTDAIVRGNAQPTVDSPVTTYFAATHGEVEFKPVLDAIKNAQDGILFLMFMPGQSPLLTAILNRVLEKSPLYIRGVVSTVTESANGVVTRHDAQVVRAGVDPALFHDEVLLPGGAPKDNLPSWAKEEFDRRLYFPAGLNAIVHSKVIVIDPFSENCVVVTGSHNFSDGASRSNDENLVIIKGNKALALTYAIHIEGVHDHYAWRAFLSQGGDPSKIYKSLDGWKPGGDKNSELRFWARTT
jgi:phosphatidylserine/phosphatidylglycerophosphate/cardiolipin synthase-like enzyme